MYTGIFFQHRPISSALKPCCGEWPFTSITFLKCSGYWVQAMLSADPGLPYLFTIRSLICFLKCPYHLLLTWNLPVSSLPDSYVVVVKPHCLLPHHWQSFLCLIFQPLTQKPFHLSGEEVTTNYTRTLCSWWRTGLKVFHILNFNWQNETSICLHHSGVTAQQFSFPCPTGPVTPLSLIEILFFYP